MSGRCGWSGRSGWTIPSWVKAKLTTRELRELREPSGSSGPGPCTPPQTAALMRARPLTSADGGLGLTPSTLVSASQRRSFSAYRQAHRLHSRAPRSHSGRAIAGRMERYRHAGSIVQQVTSGFHGANMPLGFDA